MSHKPSLVYLRFLQLSRTLALHDGMALNANELALLESIALAWHAGSPLSVQQTMALKALGSPTTLHKRLAKLRTAGLLEQASIGTGRTKLMTPSHKAIQYFDQLGQLMSLQILAQASAATSSTSR